MKYLLEHDHELNLPYSFAVKLSFVSSPLVFGKAMLIFSEEPYEIVGAAGFVYGTGANEYEDREVCQVEVAFIQEEFRHTSLFVQGLLALVEMIKEGNPDVERIQFWASASAEKESERLFSKLSVLQGGTKSVVNDLALYTVPFHALETYCRRWDRRYKK
ncbi:hypothetical protein [Paenibacillus hexagrammi]|uniref:N-acetyltransferase domain-containing protein n=1 Tax=Paenibacillus hexagrammi TaxID=2908839 RepID=A0ABY3SKU6_9BACL|nr:hypothetical protein [Paenibacillus sp. YPD9-1]UJF33849.1 hypothetical protein L0M14_00865 [Paenibacillus sp. YPD9-1]